jgi:hypothetical protein
MSRETGQRSLRIDGTCSKVSKRRLGRSIDVEALRRELGLSRLALLGHSAGAGISMVGGGVQEPGRVAPTHIVHSREPLSLRVSLI